jgi:hypothetical protein
LQFGQEKGSLVSMNVSVGKIRLRPALHGPR